MNILINILISISAAMPVPRPCIYLYFYDNGERDTYCMLIHENDSYLKHGDTIDDAMVILDCSSGILNKGEKITKFQPALINTIKSKCLEPSRLDLIIINKIYEKNLKFYKTHPISNHIQRR